MMRRVLFLLPVALFLVLAGYFALALTAFVCITTYLIIRYLMVA